MAEPERFGLTDAQLKDMPSSFAADALAGQVAVISGGAGGIGRATAWQFARMGARIVITGRKAEKIDGIVAALTEAGHDARGEVVDIRDRASVDAFWDRVWLQGPVDILINSAGGQFPQAAIDFTPKGWDAVINTNLNGTWHMMQAAALKWRAAGRGGSIANIVVVTTGGLHGVAHTIAARSGVVGLTKAVAVEWAPLGIRANCVAPGAIETDGWNVYTPEARNAYPKSNPMMRVGTAWDVAEACAYLSALSGRFVTGEVLTVDGGSQHWGETWTIPKPSYFQT
ncbi:SDR family NAD(P)-dependent oxidoreductase [Chachezhania sediminis]|uniref:SDR family NAD(P)-dependent oxidoreductase n=1 Tax=Chachezhania sediminis TaxID=2599291 RepID=UPI001E5036D1|nr:SDR family oxidoreductase [Chachezhania sediminis]